VELGVRPVKNAKVVATITYGVEPGTEEVLELLDDGIGYPDGVQFDGIYSAHFVPPVDGDYAIKLTVTRNPNVASPPLPTTRLLPIDQAEFGCVGSCEATNLEEDVDIREIQFPVVSFLNVTNYPNRVRPSLPSERQSMTQVEVEG